MPNYTSRTALCFALAACASTQVVAAPCTVPNVLANGQIADATKVMGDFNAIALCADQAITPTGTPTTGSIAVFSGAKTVTNGNLSGDVKTTGSTVTTLSNSGVTAGIYTNPTIAVDAKGRVTSAANGTGVSGGGGLILAQTADGTGNSITFSNIPSVYRDLILVIQGQSANAAQDLAMYANGDLADGNYINQTWNRFGTGGVIVPRIGAFSGSNIPNVGSPSTIEVRIFSYSSSIWRKTAMAEGQYRDFSNYFRGLYEWTWNNTSPITSLRLSVGTGNFAPGTTFSLYGR